MFGLFSSLKKSNPNTIHPSSSLIRFQEIVDRHIASRKQTPDYMAQDPIYQVPKYVVPMCEELCSLIGNGTDLREVLGIEKTVVGHSDYPHKLAQCCYHRSLKNEDPN